MKKKVRFYKGLIVEIIETICTMCLIIEKLSRRDRIEEGIYMRSHFNKLKEYSYSLRTEMAKKETKGKKREEF